VTLEDLARELRGFAADRDWERFHTPKNLAVSLAIEVGELLEHVQWRTDAEIAELVRSPSGKAAVAEELADVLIYLVRLADILDIDLPASAAAKIAANAERYPADEVRGSAVKRGR
jgi:NTP pyrophosphatase (non-canonical NTP hydrolase)